MSITVEKLEAHVEVTGVQQAERELTSFKAKTSSIMKGIGGEAKVKLLLDSTDFKAQAKKAVAEAQAEAGPIRIKVEVEGFGRELNEKIKRAQLLADAKSVKIHTNVDGDGIKSDVGGGATAVGNNIEGATRKASFLSRELAKLGKRHKVDVDTSKLDDGARKILHFAGIAAALKVLLGGLKINAVATGLGAAASAIGSLAAGVTSLLGPLGSLVGLMGVLPGLGIAMGSAFLVGKLALGGVIKGIQEQEAATKAASGQQDKEASKARSRAAQLRSNANSIRSANDGIIQSEHSLMLAQEAAGDAQKNLIDARREAARHLVDIRLQTRQLALDEEGAVNNLADARQRLNDLMKPAKTGSNWKFNEGFVTSDQNAGIAAQSALEAEKQKKLEVRDAILAIKNAELSLTRTRIEQQRQVEDGNRDLAKGVELSDSVTQAKRSEREARWGVAQAVKGEADAHRNLAETNLSIRDSMLSMAEADRADAKSKKDQLTEYNKLSQTGKNFVDFYRSTIKPALDDMKKAAGDALLPGLKSGAMAALPFLKTFKDSIALIGGAMGDVADKFGHLFGSDQFRKGFESLLSGGAVIIGRLGTAAVHVANALKNVALIAQPLTQWLSNMAVEWGSAIDRWSSDKNGKLADFFERARVNAEKVFAIVGNLYSGIKNVVAAARPLGDWIMDALVRVTDKFKVWAEAADAQRKMKDYFNAQKGPLKEIAGLVGDVAKAVFDLSNNGMATGLFAQIRKELVPALKNMAATFMSEGFGKQLITTVTSIVKLLTQMGGASGGLTMTLKVITWLSDAIESLTKNHPMLKKFVLTLFTLGYAMKALNITGIIGGLAKFSASMKMMKAITETATPAIGGIAPAAEQGATGIAGITSAIGGMTTGVGLATVAGTLLVAVGVGASVRAWAGGFHEATTKIQETEASMQRLAGTGDVVKTMKVADNLKAQIEEARTYLDNESKKPIWEQAWNRIFHSGKRGKSEALAGAKDQVEDLAFAVEQKAKIIHDGISIMAGSLGLTRDELTKLIKQYKLGPQISKGDWSGAYSVLSEHRSEWANISTEIDNAKTKMEAYWTAWDKHHGGSRLTATAGLADSQREMVGMDINPGMLTNGKFDASKLGAGALIDNIKAQRSQAFDSATSGVADGSKTADQAKKELKEFKANLEEVLAVRLGSRSAAKSLMEQMGVGGSGLYQEFIKIDAAQRKYNAGLLASTNSAETATGAHKKLNESLRMNGRSLEENTDAGKTNAAIMKQFVIASWREGTGVAEKWVGNTKAVHAQLVANTSALLDQITPWFKNRDAAAEYLGKVTGIPKDVLTTATADTGQAQAALDALKAKIDAINGAIIVAADTAKTTFNNLFSGWGGADGNPFTPNAMGGIYDTPTKALVGEDGIEVVLPLTKPKRMAELLNNPKVKAAMHGMAVHHGTNAEHSSSYGSFSKLSKEELAMHRARESVFRATEAHRRMGPEALKKWNDALGRFFYQGPVPVEPIYPHRLTPENTAAQLAQVQADADKAMAGRQHAIDQYNQRKKAEVVHQHNTFHNQVNPQITARELARGLRR